MLWTFDAGETPMIRFTALLVLLAFAAAPAVANGTGPFRAQGNEPFWSLIMSDGTVAFKPLDGAPVTINSIAPPRIEGDTETYEAMAGGSPFILTIAGKICTDTMSGMPFPKTVTVAHGGKTVNGCGGEPASLLRRDWQITEIAGKPVAPGSSPTVTFGDDGKLSGMGSCNRFFGDYSLSGEGLTAGPLGSTKMACEDVLTKQEFDVLTIIEGLAGFGVTDDGMLTLRAKDGRTLTARPAA